MDYAQALLNALPLLLARVDWGIAFILIEGGLLLAMLLIFAFSFTYWAGQDSVYRLTDEFLLRPKALPESQMRRLLGWEKHWKVPHPPTGHERY